MKRAVNIFAIAALGLLVLLMAGITLTIGWRPFLGPRMRALTNVKFQTTPERLARGEYLAKGLSGCVDCHSPHDWTTPAAEADETQLCAGTPFAGEGFPGQVFAPNLTPDLETGAGAWSDDQLARAIREGIGHDGRTLFPLMPYEHFRHMPDEDVASVVVYLRSLPPVRHSVPLTQIDSPVKYLMRDAPQTITAPVPAPDLSTPAKRGEFLVDMAVCAECHTPQVKGRFDSTRMFAGGVQLKGPWGDVKSANLTPDPSGISYYDEALFLSAMKTGKVGARTLNPIMPWASFRNLSDDDLKAMFAYLKTLKPIANRVQNTQ